MLLGMAMLYLALVLHVTGAGTLYNGIQFGMAGQWQDINLLPFSRTIDPVGYVLNIVLRRIDKAKYLLTSTRLSVKEVAYTVGYNSEENFIHSFQKHVGVPPGVFRKYPV